MSDFESRARQAAEAVRNQVNDALPDDNRAIKRAKRPNLRTLPSTAAVVVVIAASLFFINRDGSSNPTTPAGSPYQLAGALKPFDACNDLLSYYKDQAPKYFTDNAGGGDVNPLALSSQAGKAPITTTTVTSPSVGATQNSQSADSATGAAPSSATPQFSSTNVQEVGVDEPDTIKTDGQLVVTVNAGSVYLLAANNGAPQIKTKLSVGDVDNVLLSGTHLVTLADSDNAHGTITTYDITDPAHPDRIGSIQFDGKLLDARMVGQQIRVATSFEPDPDIPSPSYDDDGNVSKESKDALVKQIKATTLGDWLPQYQQLDSNGHVTKSGQLVDCSKLSRPDSFSGLDTVALLAFDAGQSPTVDRSVGVVAGGSQMYANAADTYISTTKWQDDSQTSSTDIHKFVTSASGDSTYDGSGSVDGSLLSSYSMSENDNVLRVATTRSGSRGWINSHFVSEGIVTTLRSENNKLTEIGKVAGLGKDDNESITAARFVGDRVYVSTARQTDPFYVIDLSDADHPRLAGELKIPGSTNYLQPLANNLVLSVGQSGGSAAGVNSGSAGVASDPAPPITPLTTTTVPPELTAEQDARLSQPSVSVPVQTSQLQFSLFDVSNPEDPKRVGVLNYGSGSADAAFDPHAFLYWQPRNLVVAPATVYNIDGLNRFSGLLLMQADGQTLKEIGRLADTEVNGMYNGSSVSRTIVIDDNIYMLSNDNLQVDSLETHKQVAQVNLPG